MEGAPATLRERVTAAARAAAASDPPARLRAAADALLSEAARTGERAGALPLLAADALVTLQCRWIAEHAPDRLGSLT